MTKTEKAIALVASGMAPYAAAREVGITPSNLYRELAKAKPKPSNDDRPKAFCGSCGQEIKTKSHR